MGQLRKMDHRAKAAVTLDQLFSPFNGEGHFHILRRKVQEKGLISLTHFLVQSSETLRKQEFDELDLFHLNLLYLRQGFILPREEAQFQFVVRQLEKAPAATPVKQVFGPKYGEQLEKQGVQTLSELLFQWEESPNRALIAQCFRLLYAKLVQPRHWVRKYYLKNQANRSVK